MDKEGRPEYACCKYVCVSVLSWGDLEPHSGQCAIALSCRFTGVRVKDLTTILEDRDIHNIDG